MEHCTREEFQLLIDLAIQNRWSVEELFISLKASDPFLDFKTNFFKYLTEKAGAEHIDRFFWDVFDAPFEDMPLYINEINSVSAFGRANISFNNVVAQWRLQIGK